MTRGDSRHVSLFPGINLGFGYTSTCDNLTVVGSP